MGVTVGGNGNNQFDWEGNGNETWLSLGVGMGMGMNHWEFEEVRLKKTFPIISSRISWSKRPKTRLYFY